jgi:hypothetical protein
MVEILYLPIGGEQVDGAISTEADTLDVIGKLPSIEHARLPTAYEKAKLALANCADIDECKDWADKAAAMASYAKQGDDEELLNYCKRIKARAIRRIGELYNEIEPAKNQHDAAQRAEDGTVPSSRTAVADAAGLSERQRKTAARVANVPAAEFEAAVESDSPPTIGELAERGIQKKTAPTQQERMITQIKLEASVHRQVFGDKGKVPLPASATILDVVQQDQEANLPTYFGPSRRQLTLDERLGNLIFLTESNIECLVCEMETAGRLPELFRRLRKLIDKIAAASTAAVGEEEPHQSQIDDEESTGARSP